MRKKNDDVKISPSPYAETIWRVDLSLFIILLIIPVIAICFASPLIGGVIGVILLVVYPIMMRYIIPAYVRSCSCRLTKDCIEIRRGVFFYHSVQISFSSLQYCVLSQDVIQRVFQSCSIGLRMAGASAAIRHIPLENGRKIKAIIDSIMMEEYERGDENGAPKEI